jgi:hypothetical protein
VYVAATASAAQVSVEGIAIPAIATIAAAVQRLAFVRPSEGYDFEPASLFAAMVGSSGDRKSSIFRTVTAPLRAFASEDRRYHEQARATQRARIAVLERDRERIRRGKGSPDDASRLVELERELVEARRAMPLDFEPAIGDATPEALARVVVRMGGRAFVATAEGSEVFDSLSRYSASKSPNTGLLLNGHAGDDFTVYRVGSEQIAVPAVALSILAGIQPDVVAQLLGSPRLVGRGVVQRFIVAPVGADLLRRKGHHEQGPLSEADRAVRLAHERTMAALLQLVWTHRRDDQGLLVPIPVGVSESGRVLIGEFEKSANLMALATPDELSKSFLGKRHGLAYRLALLLAIYQRAADGARTGELFAELSEDDCERGRAIAEWCCDLQLMTFSRKAAGGLVGATAKAWAKLRTRSTWTADEIGRALRHTRGLKHEDERNAALSELVERGALSVRAGKSRVYTVHPRWAEQGDA